MSDAAWLQRLHSYGLLRGSFRPEAGVATLRAYLRQRERLIEYGAAHIQHMQKAPMEMNAQLHHVVSDITGVTGMRIIRAIVAGERVPGTLAGMRDIRRHASAEKICAALSGNWRDEHIFALCQSLALYDFYQAKILECDQKLEAALKRVGECGTDLAAWPSPKHFTSWLCLAPGNKISGGKLLSSKTRWSSSRTASLLRLAATTIGRSDTTLGAFYRRLSAGAAKPKAVTATARDTPWAVAPMAGLA